VVAVGVCVCVCVLVGLSHDERDGWKYISYVCIHMHMVGMLDRYDTYVSDLRKASIVQTCHDSSYDVPHLCSALVSVVLAPLVITMSNTWPTPPTPPRSHRDRRRSAPRRSLMAELMEQEQWDRAMEVCLTHPEQMADIDPVSGATVLHRLCTKPNAPIPLVEAVVEAYPEALRIQETQYRATPLHLLSWTSQRSTAKFDVLLRYTHPDELVQLRNRFGGTVLHSVCGSQASLEVIRLLVQHNPWLVLARTHDSNETALTALWQSHLQSIPGHLQIATILKHSGTRRVRSPSSSISTSTRTPEDDDRPPTSDHFDRFWEKVTFLAQTAFQQQQFLTTASPSTIPLDLSGTELHGLFFLRAPLHAIKVAIKRHPEWARVPDGEGNYPLHVVVLRRPFHSKDVDLLELLLDAYPEAAGQTNHAGDTALVLALRDRMEWKAGLYALVRANPDLVATIVDSQTGLPPFLVAASVGGWVAVNTVYHLLCERPDVVARAVSGY